MIYQPRDDSYLLEEQVKKYSRNKRVLDIGSGSGILALAASSSHASSVLASDIDKEALDNIHIKGIKKVHSDLFNNIEGKFDLIFFNPPYLPLDKREPADSRLATTGGKKGDEVILRFLKQAKSHLTNNGLILLLVSSLTPRNKINELLSRLNLKHEILSSKSFFFETLEVWKIESK